MPFSSFFRRKNQKTGVAALDSMLSMGGSFDGDKYIRKGKHVNGINQCDDHMKSHTSTISTIAACHSHRNVKPLHQMLLAESMYDPKVVLNTKSRLSRCIEEIMNDTTVLPYLIQFLESCGTESKHMIRFWVQTECLRRSQTIDTNDFDKQFLIDSIGIYEKYLIENAMFSIKMPEHIVKEIHEKLFVNNQIEHVFENAQKFVMNTIESDYFDIFVKSSYFCKYQIDILTSDTIYLGDVLFNDFRLASNFIEFMELEGMRSYIDFLIMVRNYKITNAHYEDAITVFNKFFIPDSASSLEFSDSLRVKVKEQIDENLLNCFDDAFAILVQYFERTYLRQFLESEFFYEYLSHCISSVQKASDVKKHKRTGSESSFGSGSSFFNAIASHEYDSIVGASPAKCKGKQLLMDHNDPDSLWKRELSGKLQITHIDKYGKIIRNLEPEPDKPSSGPLSSINLTKAIKKFTLNSSHEKADEEMAWQIAEMIVNDVCKVTRDEAVDNNHLK